MCPLSAVYEFIIVWKDGAIFCRDETSSLCIIANLDDIAYRRGEMTRVLVPVCGKLPWLRQVNPLEQDDAVQ